MPPSRFNRKDPLISYRNLQAIPAKKEAQFSEISVGTSPHSDSDDLICATSHYWLTKHSSQGQLTCASYDTPGKLANTTASFPVCAGSISQFTVCPFDKLLAAGNDAGEISIFSLPEKLEHSSDHYSKSFNTIRKFDGFAKSLSVDKLAFHTTAQGILAASIGPKLMIWDSESAQGSSPAINLESDTRTWDVKWAWDGRLLGTTTRMGTLNLWDPRLSVKVASCDNEDGTGGKKCSRIAWIGDHILTTSVNKLRDRQYSVYDPRSLNAPIKTQRIDNSNGTLIPLVDPTRSILYLATRGETSFQWINFNLSSPLKAESFNSLLPIPPIAGIAMAPINHHTVDVMKAELCKFMILTNNAQVIPLTMQAPKRQYLDFHADVMPPVRSMDPAQIAQEWLEGKDHPVALVSQDPSESHVTKPSINLTKDSDSSRPTQKIPGAEVPTKTPIPITAPVPSNVKKPSSSEVKDSVQSESAQGLTCKPASISKPVRWSRKYVNGQASLKADYEDLHNLSTTFPAEREIIKNTLKFFLVPISGPGGRLGVHHLENKGRLPTQLPCLIHGSNIVAFEVDQLEQGRVYIAGEDGKVKVFRVPETAFEEDISNPELVLENPSMERISVIRPHPIAKDILMTISDDMNKPCVRLWHVNKDVDSISPLRVLKLPSGTISSAAWSLNGSRLAITNKVKTVFVLDSRQDGDGQWCQGSTHESSRPVQVTWVDDQSHIITSGFSATGLREIKLYSVNYQQRTVDGLTKIVFDNSPAAFFLHYDPDSLIGFCWGKGERTMNLFELIETPPSSSEKPQQQSSFRLESLPAFMSSTIQLGYSFFMKQSLDIKSVEIAKALRLTASQQVEVVSFKIPRNRTEFFQDDIYCDTRDFLTPSFKNGLDWLSSESQAVLIDNPARINLQPIGMPKLSDAPPTKIQTNQRLLIAKGPQLTESQQANQYLDKLFQSAKRDGDGTGDKQDQEGDDDGEIVGKSRVGAPVDDDW